MAKMSASPAPRTPSAGQSLRPFDSLSKGQREHEVAIAEPDQDICSRYVSFTFSLPVFSTFLPIPSSEHCRGSLKSTVHDRLTCAPHAGHTPPCLCLLALSLLYNHLFRAP